MARRGLGEAASSRVRSLTLLGVAAAVLVLSAGCSVEARKARYLKKADSFFDAGKYEEAKLEYLNLYKLDPRDTHALSRMGKIAFDQGQMGRALELLSRAKALAPNDSPTRRTLGLLYVAVGYRTEATAEAEALLELSATDPDAPIILAESATDFEAITAARERLLALPETAIAGAPVLVALGLLDARLGKSESAQQRFDQALAVDASFAFAHAAIGALQASRNETAAAEKAFARAAALSGPRSPRGVQYAQYKLQLGDRPGARKVLEDILQQAPDYLPAQLRLIELDTSEGRLAEAAARLDPILASEPNLAEALLAGSRLSLAQKNTDKALRQVELLLGMYPQSNEVMVEQARVQIARKDLPAAQNSLVQALAIKPNDREAVLLLANLHLRQTDWRSAIGLLRPWLEKFSPSEIPASMLEGFVLLAEALRGQGDTEETLALCDRIERALPGRAQISLLRGQVLRQQNKPTQAREAFEATLRRNPDSVAAIEQLTELDRSEQKANEARARVDTALRRQPAIAELHLLSAQLHLDAQEPVEAESALKRSVELKPELLPAQWLLARRRIASGDPLRALAHLQVVLEHAPDDLEASFLAGKLQDELGNSLAARRHYEAVLAVNPNHPGALNNLTHLLFYHLKEPVPAYEYARRAREAAPGDATIADTVGWLVFQREDYRWALGLLRESASKQPEYPEVHFHLAMTHYMLVEEDDARQAFESALAMTRTFPSVAEARSRLAILRLDPLKVDAAGRARLDRHLAAHPRDPVALSRLAALREKDGALAEALTVQERAIRASPQAVRSVITLAQMLAAQGKPGPALAQAEAARLLAPDDVAVAFELGKLAYRLKGYSWSFSLLQVTTRTLSDNPDFLLAYAASAYSVGRLRETRDALENAQRLAPTPATAERLRLIEAAGSNDSALAAVPAARERLAIEPNDVAAWMVLATAASSNDEVQRHLEQVLTVYPNFAPAQRRLAMLLSADPTQDPRTIQLGALAADVLRDDTELARTLGLVAFRQGDHRRAIGWLESAKPAYLKDAMLWFQLGMSQSELNQTSAATDSLERALALGLSGPAADAARARVARLRGQ